MIRPIFPVITVLASAAMALVLSGCEKPQIRVYTAPKDAPPATPAPTAAAEEPRPEPPPRPKPQVSYSLPAGWEETGANSISVANFLIKTDAGKATANITPLGGLRGMEAAVVNMMRSQVGQPPLTDQEIAASHNQVQVAGSAGQLFEINGTTENKPIRILTAIAQVGDQSWFYKLEGDEAVVAAQKPAFMELLKSVKIKESAAPAETAATTPPAPTEPAPPAMVAPESWQAVPAGQMQVAKFAVKTSEGAKADVSVSVFPSDTGGTLANVNRWRRQLGLPDVDEAGLQECVTPLEGASIDGAPGAILADLTHENRRLLGAIVPRDGRWWFYKMMGDAPAVSAERENFVHFVKNQP